MHQPNEPCNECSHKTASYMFVAKNIHSCLHWQNKMSVIMQIILGAATHIFSCHSFETAFIITIISAK